MIHTAIALFSFLAAIDVTILATIMPQVIASVGQMQLYPMLGASYLVAFFITTPIFGKVADHFGCKKAAYMALLIFLLGSLSAGFSYSMPQLILSRLLQGAGAAGLVNISNILIARLYQKDSKRSLMQAILVSSVWAFASIVGPLMAAYLTLAFSWRYVFFINVPVVLLAAILMSRFHETHERIKDRFDLRATALFIVGSLLFFFATLKATSQGLGLWKVALILVASAIIYRFIQRSLQSQSPLVPFKLLQDKEIAICIFFGMVSGACLVSSSSLVSLYIQGALRKSLQEAGFVITATSIGWTCGSFFAGFLLRYASLALLASISLAALTSALFMLSQATLSAPLTYFLIANLILGFGLGSMVNFTIVGVQRAAAARLLGRATSFLSLMRALAGSIGAATAGLLQLSFFRSELASSNLSQATIENFTLYPEKFLDKAIQSGVSTEELAQLQALFGLSIEKVFLIPVFIIVLVAPPMLYFYIKKSPNNI